MRTKKAKLFSLLLGLLVVASPSFFVPYRTDLSCQKPENSHAETTCSIIKEKIFGATELSARNVLKAEIHEIHGGFTKGNSLGLVTGGNTEQNFLEISFFSENSKEALKQLDVLNVFFRSDESSLHWSYENEHRVVGIPILYGQIFMMLLMALSLIWDFVRHRRFRALADG